VIRALAMVAALGLQAGDLPVRSIDRGFQSGVEAPRQVVVTSADAFAALWREHSIKPAPMVDFTREAVVAVFLGVRQTAGFSVDIVSVTGGPMGTVVTFRERTPGADAITAQVLTFPYVIAAVQGLTPPVRFESVR
jgi:hypothetical protein